MYQTYRRRGYRVTVSLAVAMALLLFGVGADAREHEKGRVHLLFHVGQSVNGLLSVGGTVENRGSLPVREGFVVVVPLDGQCYPGTQSLPPFGALSPGEKKGFSVLLGEGVHGYRLLDMMALDDMGYPLAVTDDTASVVAGREATQRQACERMRTPV